jgi:predicted DNA-binding transcriptional regulator AlpA
MARAVATRTVERQGQRYEWMSLADFCEELGVAPNTAYKWSSSGPNSGRFPRFRKLPNGSIRIRRDWFEEWVESLGPAA